MRSFLIDNVANGHTHRSTDIKPMKFCGFMRLFFVGSAQPLKIIDVYPMHVKRYTYIQI